MLRLMFLVAIIGFTLASPLYFMHCLCLCVCVDKTLLQAVIVNVRDDQHSSAGMQGDFHALDSSACISSDSIELRTDQGIGQ